MERKIINVSKKRQITIPLKFYEKLDLGNEVECSLENGAIVIRPIYYGTSEFLVEILRELVSEGYCGDDLIRQFETQSRSIKGAVSSMLEEADAIASGDKKAAKMDDIFDPEG